MALPSSGQQGRRPPGRGLGWPGQVDEGVRAGLGWPARPMERPVISTLPEAHPQADSARKQGYAQPRPQDGAPSPDPSVSRETMASDRAEQVPRETSGATEHRIEDQGRDAVTDQYAADVMGFGPFPAPGTGFRTAGDVAATTPLGQETTPMARAVAHQLLVQE